VRANPMPAATIADVADHIDHVRKVAGLDHVGIGGDFDGTSELPRGLEDVSCYPALIAELIDRDWTAADCAKLANGNILRVLRDAVDAVDTARQARPAQPAGLAGSADRGRLVLGAEATGL
jgi:membrane dipeptidase